MQHRIPCCGYLFREQPRRRSLLKEKLPAGLTARPAYAVLTQGQDAVNEATGAVLARAVAVSTDPAPARSYAFCSDTLYLPSLAPLLRGVDLLYHEATFLDELRARAAATHHSTARQAAQLAQQAEVGRLLIGHFSSRYRDLEPLLAEAQAVYSRPPPWRWKAPW